MLVILLLTEHSRWLRSLWPANIYHSLFYEFYNVSVCYGLVIGPLAVASAIRLFLHRATDKRADALTIARRRLIIPGTYLLAAMWSSAWLAGQPAGGFGATVLTLYLADQFVSNLYHGFRKAPPDGALRDKDPTVGGLRRIALELGSMLSLKARMTEMEL